MEIVIILVLLLVTMLTINFVNRSCKREIAKVARSEYLRGFGEAISQLNSFDGKDFVDRKYAEYLKNK